MLFRSLEFDRVKVEISVFDEDDHLIRTFNYTIGEHGYGDEMRNIYDLSPELNDFEGDRLTSQRFAHMLAVDGAEPTSAEAL